MFKRILDLKEPLKSKSCFLFGPRQTGKTSLVEMTLPKATRIDLLKSEVYRAYSARPELLRQSIQEKGTLVVIDEIQRLPELLNEVHALIESHKTRFLLTGSSARKLRGRGVNLLGGRARSRILHPLVRKELGDSFDLNKALHLGLLPSIWTSDSPWEDLGNYAGEYLQTEIAAERATRDIPAFSRFLEVAALSNGRMMNYTQLASDCEVKLATVRNYFEILAETLIATTLEAWVATKKRKAITTSKFYFFDSGVAHVLQGRRTLTARTPEFGEAFEAYIHHELRAWMSYSGEGTLHYWRSKSGFEVDFLLNGETAIEVKAKNIVSKDDLRGLKAIGEEKNVSRSILVCLVTEPRREGEIEMMPFTHFLNLLWAGEIT